MPSDKTIYKFLNKAKEASKQATYPRQKLGSVLVYGNKIIAIGYNTNKTTPVQYRYNKYRGFKDFHAKNNGSAHAEIYTLIKTRYLDVDWNNTILYIYRELKSGQLALSMPCLACSTALSERGIGTVIFSDDRKECGYTIWKLEGKEYIEV